MRYDRQTFDKAVDDYKDFLKDKPKEIMVYGEMDKDVFFSMAPFSRAAAEMDIDLYVSLAHNAKPWEVLFDVWNTYEALQNGEENEATQALKTLLEEIDIEGFEKYFEKPEIIKAQDIPTHTEWFTPFMQDKLKETTDAIIENVYALQPDERFSIGFALVMDDDFLSHPLQDYLDSYAINYNMFLSAKESKAITLKASTPREGARDDPQPTAELKTTLVGMELEKDIDTPVFKAYKKLSEILNLDRMKIAHASFFTKAKGYHGKHIFGEKRGYPTKNMKTKWSTPGGMIYKFHWYPQSEMEDRPPLSRLSFTSTVPIDKFIESTLIDYDVMRERNKQIRLVMERSDKVIVKGDGSDFEVGLIKDGRRRRVLGSDSDTRHIINPRIYEETGKQMGMMANIPGGEAFTTPSYVKGKVVGDVVINIDRSYRLSADVPFVAEADGEEYKIISGPKDVVAAFEKKKKEAWENIMEQEKNESVSPEIIELKKKNFHHIGEFAINTNPKAKLCDYLIINEKIANMIHIAFGSGFEPDASTEYHMDVVIDAPRQKLDIYGVDEKGNEHWILKEGKFVI